jgi:hypothetical protein
VAPFELSDELLSARLPASESRSAVLARLVRRASVWTRERNGAEIVGRVKRARVVQQVLYRRLEEKPQLLPADVAFIRSALESELVLVEERFGVDLRRRWGWGEA